MGRHPASHRRGKEEGVICAITRSGRVVTHLVAPTDDEQGLVLGTARGSVWIADDFDAPLDDDLLDAFEGG